jgi:hypothetical protein
LFANLTETLALAIVVVPIASHLGSSVIPQLRVRAGSEDQQGKYRFHNTSAA